MEYRVKNWVGAMTHFRKAAQTAADKPALVMFERCKGIMEKVHPELQYDWDQSWPLDF